MVRYIYHQAGDTVIYRADASDDNNQDFDLLANLSILGDLSDYA